MQNQAGSTIQAWISNERQTALLERALDRLGERKEYDGVYLFEYRPTNNNWDYFHQAARELHTLDVDGRYTPILNKLSEMGNVNRAFPFPNLKSLRWKATSNRDLMDLSCLIVPTLVSFALQVQLPDIPLSYLSNIYQALRSRVSRLQYFQISLPDNIQIAMPQIQIFMNLLNTYSSTLTQVQIPTVLVLPSIIQCLSKMPNLSDVYVGFSSCSLPSLLNPIQHAPSNRQRYFTSLRDFSYCGIPRALYDNFLRVYDLSALSVFSWNVKNGELDDLKEFLQLIEGCCPRLTELSLGTCGMYLLGGEPPVFSWSAVEGLLACRYLTSISIYYALVDIDRAHLAILLRSRDIWKRVELYTLNPLAFEDMLLYGRYCRNLTCLGMTLQAPSADAISRLNHPFPPVFPRLRQLDLGDSSIPIVYRVPIGTFLFRISQRPVYVLGHDGRLWQGINRTIADLYIDRAAREGIPFSPRVEEYISTVNLDGENMEMEGGDFDDESDE